MDVSPHRLFQGDWRRRMDLIVETMREVSLQTDPQSVVRAYTSRMRQFMPAEGFISLSRRELPAPKYRITRSSTWKAEIDPWTERDRLPVLEGGLLGELIYGEEPRIIDDLRVAPGDPAAEYLTGHRSVMAVPQYFDGVAMNMTVLLRKERAAFDREIFPEWVWMSNLFGRSTHNLRLAQEVKAALEIVDRELKLVADIQRSLLPREMPRIPTLDLAAYYQTSRWAGGDYYDFFPLPDDKWGFLIADVSGHGTPVAVMMAITHSIAHSHPGPATPPNRMLDHVNRELANRYTTDSDTFVTAFYGVYDPTRRELSYTSAGHNPPRLKRCEDGTVMSLDGARGLPLGIWADESYESITQSLVPGDQIVFYTDGITEALNPDGKMFGLERLDEVLENCSLTATGLLETVIADLERFTAGRPPADDQTLLVAKVS